MRTQFLGCLDGSREMLSNQSDSSTRRAGFSSIFLGGPRLRSGITWEPRGFVRFQPAGFRHGSSLADTGMGESWVRESSPPPLTFLNFDHDHIEPLFDRIQFDPVHSMIGVGINEGAALLARGRGKPDGFETGGLSNSRSLLMFAMICASHRKKSLVPFLLSSRLRMRHKPSRLPTPYGAYRLSSDRQPGPGGARFFPLPCWRYSHQRKRFKLRFTLRRVQTIRQRSRSWVDAAEGPP